jgi:N6-adenosine-specific RNA methylase IME4/ParB-like chromosome segregation protein Spo0J
MIYGVGKMGALPIDKIIIGNRHRRDKGDVTGLARSIDEIGLLHPIVVRSDHTLIAGERRLSACRELGWTEVPVTVISLEEIVRGELAENVERKNFLPSEIDAIRRAVEPIERAAAKGRQGARNDLVESFHEVGAGKTRDKIGAFAGVSGRTVAKIAEVIDAAKAEPKKYGKLADEMDRTGRVDGVHKRWKVMRQAEGIRREKPPLPGRGPYRVIVADPPWPDETRKDDRTHRATTPYPHMSIEQICAERVADIAHDDCVLWLWTTNGHVRHSFEVLDAWGFEQKTILTWVKDKMGLGDWLRGQTEHCLMAVRGKPTVILTNQTTALCAPRGVHSQKPDAFYDMVEALCPAPRYAYLWSRSTRARWDCHGDEVPAAQSAAA